ncbi:MAG: STAS domain-containing protein [bacterium]
MGNIRIKITEKDEFIYITPSQSLTDTYIKEFNAKLMELCEKNNKHIVFDFLNVDYLYSGSVTVIVKFYKVLHEKGKQLVIINASETIKKILKSINLFEIVTIFDNYEQFLLWASEIDNTPREKNSAELLMEEKNGIGIARLNGDVESVNRLNLKAGFDEISANMKGNRLIIDLSKVISLDSTSIASLVLITKKIKQGEGRLVLAGVNNVIKELFQIIDIEKYFVLVDDVDAGIKLFSSFNGK